MEKVSSSSNIKTAIIIKFRHQAKDNKKRAPTTTNINIKPKIQNILLPLPSLSTIFEQYIYIHIQTNASTINNNSNNSYHLRLVSKLITIHKHINTHEQY